MIYVVILYFFLKLPGNVLGAAYNQVRLIVRNLRYVIPLNKSTLHPPKKSLAVAIKSPCS